MSLHRSHLTIVLLALSALPMTGCVGLAAGAGATAGVAAASDGGISGAVNDVKIKASINDLWFRRDVDMFRKLNLTVDQGRVLITGVVQNPEHRVEAVRLAWQPTGVKQVINEIRVADSEGVEGYVTDSWINAQLRTKMTLDRDIQSINYSIDTVQGIIYLMGTAQNQMELNHVIETARAIKGVKQVISYVKLRNEVVPAQPLTTGVVLTPSTVPGTTTGTNPAVEPMSDVPAPVQIIPMTGSTLAPVTTTPLSP